MEQETPRHVALLRAAACGVSGLGALLTAQAVDLRPLDVALWSVLVPLGVGAGAILLPQAWRWAARSRHRRSTVVVPDAEQVAPEAVVPARESAVQQARRLLLAARDRGAPLDELLALARALHEATLELADATAAAGGHVPQALRDELALRDRVASQPVGPQPYG